MNELRKVNNENWYRASQKMRWVERDNSGKVIGTYEDNPKVGYTLAIDPYDNQFQTQPITEIIDLTDKIIHFKTKDEEYKLYLHKHFQEIYNELEKMSILPMKSEPK